MDNLISTLQNQSFNSHYKIYGIYTLLELDAAKLAYITPANILEDPLVYTQSEVHTFKKDISYFYHFHDKNHNFHIWYGSPHYKGELL